MGLLFAMIACLILIAIMRWIARPLVWLSILGVLSMLGFGKNNILISSIAIMLI